MSKSFSEAFREVTGGSWLDDLARESLSAAGEKFGGDEPPQITVTKASAWLPVSEELAMDAGIIPDTRPRPALRKRLRWKAAAARERAARRAYRLIAGDWPYEPDPYDD